jgi:hypothetical protein
MNRPTIHIGSAHDYAMQLEYRLFDAQLEAARAGDWERSRRLINELEKAKQLRRTLTALRA